MIQRIGADVQWKRGASPEQLDDPIAKNTMRDIARSYEQLATLAEGKGAPKT